MAPALLSSSSSSLSSSSSSSLSSSSPQEPSSSPPPSLDDPPLLSQVGAAIVGGTCVMLVTTPFDVVKVRMQVLENARAANNLAALRVACRPSPPLELTACLVRTEGVRRLWSGLTPGLLMNVPGSVIYFTTYERVKRRVRRAGASGSLPAMLAGAASRTLAAAATAPFEMVRTNLQSQSRDAYLGFSRTFSAIVRARGVRGLFAGLVPTLFRDVPFSMLYWATFEALRDRALPRVGSALGMRSPPPPPPPPPPPSSSSSSSWSSDAHVHSHFATNFLSGWLAGMLAATVTMPIDVVKTRRQARILDDAAGARRSTLESLACIWRLEGVAGLFSGLVPRVVRTAPACAIMISSYEAVKRWSIDACG